MDIRLEKATITHAQAIFDLQVKAFNPLLKTYRDYHTSPANETIERVITRINNPNGGFYQIFADKTLVGAICIYWKENVKYWISPMFISPDFQGKGIAQKAILLVEGMFPNALS